MNEHDEVMTENLTKRLVDHRGIRLAAKAITKFPLNHAESGFDIRPLVIVLQKLRALELEVVVHLRPRSCSASRVAHRKRDEWRRSTTCNGVSIAPRRVALVSRDFRDLEVSGRGIDQRRKQLGVTGPLPMNLNRRYDIRFDATSGEP